LVLAKNELRLLVTVILVTFAISFVSGLLVASVKASPASVYYYRFDVDREGFTDVTIKFNSTDSSGDSWVFVPKFQDWNYSVTAGQISGSEIVDTDEVVNQAYYFYQAFKFRYVANGLFNMTIKFDFDNGALIVEPRGIFYSPQIGFKPSSDGVAQIFFHHSFQIDADKAIALLEHNDLTTKYPATDVETNRARFVLQENIGRLQVEFSIESATAEYVTLKSSDNTTFAFKSLTRYESYARNVLKLYDLIYGNFTQLFNVTLASVAPVEVQFFLPDFDTLLSVGGFVPFTGEQLGEININIVFIRAVNGTVEVIATHELVHRFLGKAQLSPSNLLWFHEGMAQYVSTTFIGELGYEGGVQERQNLEQSSVQVYNQYNGDIGFIQQWTPTNQPEDIAIYYAASYYITSQLAEMHGGLSYYQRFFKLIQGAMVNNNNVLAYYLSAAANASVAITLMRWGFSIADLYTSPELVDQAARAIEATNPVFQPYRWLAEYLFNQAQFSLEAGNVDRANSLLRLSIAVANAAPLLTFLTIIIILGLLVYFLSRRSTRPRPAVPPLLPEILQPST